MATTSKTVTVNYTDEQTTKMIVDYTAGVTVEKIAAELGKNARSVIAKLSREKVYKAKERTTKTGEKIACKNDLADAIGAVLKMTEQEVTGLASAPKPALQKIFTALANSKPIDG